MVRIDPISETPMPVFRGIPIALETLESVSHPRGRRRLTSSASRLGAVSAVRPASDRAAAFVRLLRPAHWIKNVFVLAPLVFAGAVHDLDMVARAVAAMALFCLASSLIYVFNDLCDVERDRMHPVKSVTRPIAAGEVSRSDALAVLAGIGLLLAVLGLPFMAVVPGLMLYIALNLAYTTHLKHVPIVDLLVLASGFVLRVYLGAEAIGVHLSWWMFIMTLSLALFIAVTKRLAEARRGGHETRAVLAMYSPRLLATYAEIALLSAMICYGLFVVTVRPSLLVTVPFVVFGLFRYRHLTGGSTRGESPVDLLIQDGPLAASVVLWAGACFHILAQV